MADDDHAMAKTRLTAMGYAKLAEQYTDEATRALRAARTMTARLDAMGDPQAEPAAVYNAIAAGHGRGHD